MATDGVRPKRPKRLKALVAIPDPPDQRRARDEAAIEHAWKMSGDLRIIALRVTECRQRNEPPPAWVDEALRDLADASRPADKHYAQNARSLVRYVAVREAPRRTAVGRLLAARRRNAARPTGGGEARDDPGYRWGPKGTQKPRDLP